MAKKQKTKRKYTRHMNGSSFLVVDPKIMPVVAQFGRSAEISYPAEFTVLDSLKVNQSASFPKGKLNIVNAIRTRMQKIGNKKFIVRKVDPSNNRIWRLPDNAPVKTWSRVKKEVQPKPTAQ